jgi:nucleotide-binding universal stress UspA family protein
MSEIAEVVVGLGDGRNGFAELDWGAREARNRATSLRLVRAFTRAAQLYPWETAIDAQITADQRRAAGQHVAVALDHLRSGWADVPVEVDIVEGDAARILIERSSEAAVTVVGSRQLGAIGATVLGSVSGALAVAGRGPIVISSISPCALGVGDVIVGVDGLDGSDEVFAFAFDFASRYERTVHALVCWRRCVLNRPHHQIAERLLADQAHRWLADAVGVWADKYPEVGVRQSVSDDDPVTALAKASYGQELVVLGSSSASHLAHPRIVPLLGATPLGVLHHATCPAAVVHPRVNPPAW